MFVERSSVPFAPLVCTANGRAEQALISEGTEQTQEHLGRLVRLLSKLSKRYKEARDKRFNLNESFARLLCSRRFF
jgi:hypothetical protein